jgi:hypothetical protein
VQLYRYFVSQSIEFCRHNPLCYFSTSVYCCCLFRYGLSPETFGHTLLMSYPCYFTGKREQCTRNRMGFISTDRLIEQCIACKMASRQQKAYYYNNASNTEQKPLPKGNQDFLIHLPFIVRLILLLQQDSLHGVWWVKVILYCRTPTCRTMCTVTWALCSGRFMTLLRSCSSRIKEPRVTFKYSF